MEKTATSSEAETDFTICVKPAFQLSDANQLVEFVELHRILGARKVVFYVLNGTNWGNSKSWTKYLEFYSKSGIVDIYNFTVTEGRYVMPETVNKARVFWFFFNA